MTTKRYSPNLVTECDYLWKICLLGDSGVGKSSLLRHLQDGTFSEQGTSTIGVDVFTLSTELCGKKINLQIWDTAGQERFNSLLPAFLRRAIGFVIVFDVTDAESFQHASKWKSMADASSPGGMKFLVASKSDLDEKRVITKETATRWATENGMQYCETSAKLGMNIEQLFDTVIHDLSAAPRLEVDISPRTKPPAQVLVTTDEKGSQPCCS